MQQQQIVISSLSSIHEAAREFLSLTEGHTLMAFYGSMGAGKTTFIKALCEELGVEDEVTSPTFAIVNEYLASDGPIYHFDFYRIKRQEEVLDIGFEEYAFSGRLCLMEWPELIEDYLPEETLKITISAEADGRRIIRF